MPEEEGCKDAAICERLLGGKDVRRVGRWKTGVEVEATSNVTSNWEYRISYKADCAARPDADGVVTLEFWCGTTLVGICYQIFNAFLTLPDPTHASMRFSVGLAPKLYGTTAYPHRGY